jgi:thiamine biosynthesis lipoprotein
MGSRVHVTVIGGDEGLLEHAQTRLMHLEQLWSRFVSTSDLSRLNAAEGAWVEVAPETIDLLRLAVEAWSLTGGLFDPTVLDAVEASGYDRNFEDVREGALSEAVTASGAPVPGCGGIELDGDRARLPHGVRLDPGGIGKGRAADVVAAELMELGARGACVNVGGDVRVMGEAPVGSGMWAIAVEDPWDSDRAVTQVGITGGAVASSSTLRRRWRSTEGTTHHLIDPRSGRSATSDVVATTVVAAEAMWAEIFAKCLVISGTEGLELLGRFELAAMAFLRPGVVVRTSTFDRYEPWTPTSGGTWHEPVA